MAAINNKTTVFDAGEVFGGRKSGRPVVGFMEPNPYVPDEDIRYVMPEWAGAIAFWFAHVKDPLFVFGPTGCGKTSAVKQLARRINYPVYETTGHNRMEFPELVGHRVPGGEHHRSVAERRSPEAPTNGVGRPIDRPPIGVDGSVMRVHLALTEGQLELDGGLVDQLGHRHREQ